MHLKTEYYNLWRAGHFIWGWDRARYICGFKSSESFYKPYPYGLQTENSATKPVPERHLPPCLLKKKHSDWKMLWWGDETRREMKCPKLSSDTLWGEDKFRTLIACPECSQEILEWRVELLSKYIITHQSHRCRRINRETDAPKN